MRGRGGTMWHRNVFGQLLLSCRAWLSPPAILLFVGKKDVCSREGKPWINHDPPPTSDSLLATGYLCLTSNISSGPGDQQSLAGRGQWLLLPLRGSEFQSGVPPQRCFWGQRGGGGHLEYWLASHPLAPKVLGRGPP